MKGFLPVFGILICLIAGHMTAFAGEKVVKITIPSHLTPAYKDLFPGVRRFVDRINQLGGGKVEAELHHSQSLFKVREIVPALMNGSCEMIFHSSVHTTGSWPEIDGLALPFLYKNEKECQEKWRIGGDLLNLVNKEMDRKYGVRVIAPGVLKGLILATREKTLKTPDDMKGLKLRGTGKQDAEFVRACGASPTFLPSSELYEAIRRGRIDGLVTYPGTLAARDLDKALGHMLDMEPMLSAWGYQIYVLNRTFDRWPKEVRDIIELAAYEYDYRYLDNSLKYYEDILKPRLGKNMEFFSPSPEQMGKFWKIGLSTYGKWLESVDESFGKKFLELSRKSY